MLSAQEKLSGATSGLEKLKSAYEEFKDVARFDRKIDKAYLEGRFGAIANIDINYEN